MLVVGSTDEGYETALPNIIDDAEQRVYRDVDLLGTVTRFSSVLLSTASRNVTLPSSVRIVVLESLNVYTPVGTTTTRNPLVPTSRDFIDAVFPQEISTASSAVPAYFAMVTDQSVIVAPPSGSPYTLEVVATVRPGPLSSANSSTYLTAYLPDLFMAAAMVYGSAYQKNWGAATDDPRQAMSWEQHYNTLLQSALVEEARKKFMAEGWQSKSPVPIATPPRV